MTTTPVRAIYRDGRLCPHQPLALSEGAEVELIILHQNGAESDTQALATALAEIAAMPMEADDAEFSGVDHDRVLYGTAEQP